MRIPGLFAATAIVISSALGGLSADEGKTSAGRWVLDLKHGPLDTVEVPGARSTVTAYHYMTLKVTNNTAFTREWRPMVRAIVDTKPDAPYYALPLTESLDAIRRQERNQSLPMLSETMGKIDPGQTIECVAIFGRLDPMYDRVNVQVHGLSSSVAVFKVEKYPGERVIVVDAAYHDRNQKVLEALRKEAREAGSDKLPAAETEVQEILERRFWDIAYTRRGDEHQAEDSPIVFVNEGWKLDGEPKVLRVIVGAGK